MTHLHAIDLHTHIIPHELPAYAGAAAEQSWPSITHGDCGHRHVIIGERAFRTFSPSSWDPAQRIADMDRMGIGRQVLSPMPELLSHWFSAGDALSLGHFINDYIAGLVATSPSRFIGLGMVPLQDPALAARELPRLLAAGLAGVEIGSNINGLPIGDPSLLPFFAAAEDLGVPIFVHALKPAGRDRLVGPPGLEQIIAFPGETGLAIASLITGGTLERHPRLKLAFSHGGGTIGLLLARLDYIWSISPQLSKTIKRRPIELARGLYYDTLVYDAATLRFLIDVLGETQFIVGTDYPFSIYDRSPIARIETLELPGEQRDLLISGNARRFLGIGSG